MIDNLKELEEFIISEYPREAVGFVVKGKFIPLENVASEPFSSFVIRTKTYLKYEKEIDYIIHSHTFTSNGSDPRTPSKADMLLARNTRLQQGILHCNGTSVSDILFWNLKEPRELLGREYIPNVYDCMTIVTDYFRKEHNIVMDNMPRDAYWFESQPRLLEENVGKQEGFIRVPIGEEKPSDVLVFAYSAPFATHLGIYIGEGKFIHHIKGIPSCEDKLSAYPRQHMATYRYENL